MAINAGNFDQMVGADKGFWNQPGIDRTRTWGKAPTPRAQQRQYTPQGGTEMAFTGASRPAPAPRRHAGPMQGGREVPGTPNTSPSTLSPEFGLMRAVQGLDPDPETVMEMPGADGINPPLGARRQSGGSPMAVLQSLVRGVY